MKPKWIICLSAVLIALTATAQINTTNGTEVYNSVTGSNLQASIGIGYDAENLSFFLDGGGFDPDTQLTSIINGSTWYATKFALSSSVQFNQIGLRVQTWTDDWLTKPGRVYVGIYKYSGTPSNPFGQEVLPLTPIYTKSYAKGTGKQTETNPLKWSDLRDVSVGLMANTDRQSNNDLIVNGPGVFDIWYTDIFGASLNLSAGTDYIIVAAPVSEASQTSNVLNFGVLNTSGSSDGKISFLNKSNGLAGAWSQVNGHGIGFRLIGGSNPPVPGNCVLNVAILDYSGDKTSIPLTVTIDDTYTMTKYVDASGNIQLNWLAGNHKIMIDGANWLANAKNISIPDSGSVTFNFTLVNGDTNNDNTIDDYDVLNIAYDLSAVSNIHGITDLDGDGICSTTDLVAVTKSIGLKGDN